MRLEGWITGSERVISTYLRPLKPNHYAIRREQRSGDGWTRTESRSRWSVSRGTSLVGRGREGRSSPPRAEILEIPVAHACPNRLSQSSSSRGPQPAHIHLRVVTVVPLPHSELISNSSMIRRTPGRPNPRLLEVENPSRIASVTSRIPGPEIGRAHV